MIGRGCRRGPRQRPSPETLPPGEGGRGAHARLSVGAKGRGIARRRSPTAGRDRRWGDPFAPSSGRPCVGEPAVPLAHGPEGDGPARIRGVRLVRIPRATSPPATPPRSELDRRRLRAPAIVTRRADRRGLGRAWGKGRGVARDETRPGLLNQQDQGRDVPGAGRAPRPKPQKRGAMPIGQGRGIIVILRRSGVADGPPASEIAERSRSSNVGMDPKGHMQGVAGCRIGLVLFENEPLEPSGITGADDVPEGPRAGVQDDEILLRGLDS